MLLRLGRTVIHSSEGVFVISDDFCHVIEVFSHNFEVPFL